MVLFAAIITLAGGDSSWAANVTRGTGNAKKFDVHEIVLTGNGEAANPFTIDATVTFAPKSIVEDAVTVKAFYDGDNIWRARLYVSQVGRWSWTSRCLNDDKLNGRKGSFRAVESNLRGKLRPHLANPRQWATDDGRTFLNLSDDALATAIPTPKPEPHGPSRAQCARRGDDEYLIYLPCANDGERSGGGGGSDEQKSRGSCMVDKTRTPGVRIDLRKAHGMFQVEWYRAADGTDQADSPVEGGELCTLTAPWQGVDVVLRLLGAATRPTTSDVGDPKR